MQFLGMQRAGGRDAARWMPAGQSGGAPLQGAFLLASLHPGVLATLVPSGGAQAYPRLLSGDASSVYTQLAKRAFRGLPLGHPCPMRGAVTPTATEDRCLADCSYLRKLSL